MLDLSRISDTFSGWPGGNANQAAEQSGGIQDLLHNAGLDPSLLEGLDQKQIFEMLSQFGIDPSLLEPDQVNDLLQSSAVSEHLANVASDWLGGGKA